MAGRPRVIDRDKLLDAAEMLVSRVGAAGLSFESVARAAGVTKGGVQYCFGTKDGLINAMIERWGNGFEARVAALTGGRTDPASVIRGHIATTREEDEAGQSRSAAMLSALLQSPAQVAANREWYNRRLAGLDLQNPADLSVAVAFLAGEGAFLLRAFGLADIDGARWDALFDGITALAESGADQSAMDAGDT